MDKQEKELIKLGWVYDEENLDWVSPHTLIGYSFEAACRIENINKTPYTQT